MSKAQKAVTVNASTKPPHFRYLFIVDDLVIGKTNDLNEAIRLARKHPEAELRDDHISRDLDSLVSHRRWERQRAKETSNPAGEAIKEICGPVLYSVEDTIGDVIPNSYIEDGCWGDGRLRFYRSGATRIERRATSVECCKWKGRLSAEFTMDVRQPIPPQVAAWLTKLSKLALKAADDMQYIDDDRDMKVLNKVVSDDGYLDRLWKQKKHITYGGEVEPIDPDEIEYLARRRAKQVGAA